MNGSAAFRARYQSFVLTLAIVLRSPQTLGTKQRRRVHLKNDDI